MGESEPTPPPPPLGESARTVYEAARNVAGAWGGNFAALRRLLVADIALAKMALVHGLVRLFAAAILFGTTWVLLTLLAVWGMHRAGMGWGWAIAIPMFVSLGLGALALWQAMKTLELADLDASRRQLTLWFGTADEVEEARQAPPGSLQAGAPAHTDSTP